LPARQSGRESSRLRRAMELLYDQRRRGQEGNGNNNGSIPGGVFTHRAREKRGLILWGGEGVGQSRDGDKEVCALSIS